jgi:hypothetical protein
MTRDGLANRGVFGALLPIQSFAGSADFGFGQLVAALA